MKLYVTFERVVLRILHVSGSHICMISDVLRFFTVSPGLYKHVPGYTSVLGYDPFSFHVPSFRHALVILILDTV